jgi:hypothetical protein
MPQTRVIFFMEEDGSVPIIEWLDELTDKAQDKCLAKLKRLEDLGHELRRPEADFLRDGSTSFGSVSRGSTIGSSTSFTAARPWWSHMDC